MADKYDNGYTSDFKRNTNQDPDNEQQDGEVGQGLNEKAGEYMRELLSEKIKLNNQKFPVSSKLIDQEITKVQASGRIPSKDSKYVDVYREKPVKVTVKVLVPVKEHPKFNFVGKLLGPKGNTMKHFQEETMCKMAVLGRGSIRDRQKEEELRNSLDPKYAHLSDELHVEISAFASPAEAYARIAYAMAEIKKCLIPDTNDVIRQAQMREIIDRDTNPRPPLLANPDINCQHGPRSIQYGHPRPAGPPGRAPPRMPPAPPPMQRMPTKSKVISILDRARSAMETSYSYDDPYAAVPEPPQVRGGPRAGDPEYYYERGHERFYEDEPYYKEEPAARASAREVGTRRAPPAAHARTYTHARAAPYGARPAKPVGKKRPQ